MPVNATRRVGLFLLAVLVLALLALPPLVPAHAVAEPHPDPPTADGEPRADSGTVFVVARHNEPSALVAQSLGGARWDVGAVGAQWTHRAPWMEPVTGAGVRVAVLDTGIDATHPDLAGKVVAWRDFVHGRAEPYDDDGHGTQVAGAVAAQGHLQIDPLEGYFPRGARGMAPGVDLIAAKAMSAGGEGDPHRIAQAIMWSLDPNGDGDPADGANVINLSLGVVLPQDQPETGARSLLRPADDPGEVRVVADAIRAAVKAGAVVVVSAGNHEAGEPGRLTFPGTMDEVITVGATGSDGRIAAFSNAGAKDSGKPDLVAPGVLYTTSASSRYIGAGGTSLATPLVAGAVALLMEAEPGLAELTLRGDRSSNTDAVRSILVSTARPVHDAPREVQGAGLLRVDAALAAVGPGEAGLRSELAYVVVAGLLVPLAVVRRRRRQRRIRVKEAAARQRASEEARRPMRPLPIDPTVWADPGRTAPRAPARAIPAWVPPARAPPAGWAGPRVALAAGARPAPGWHGPRHDTPPARALDWRHPDDWPEKPGHR